MPANDDLGAPSQGERRAISGYEPQYALAAEMALRAAREGSLRAVRLIDPNANIADDFQILTDGRIDAFQVKWGQTPSAFSYADLKSLVRGLADGRKQLLEQEPGSRVVVHVITNGPASTHDSIRDRSQTRVGSFYELWTEILQPSRTGTEVSVEALARWNEPLEDLRISAGLSDQEFQDFLRDLCVDLNATLLSERTDPIGFRRQRGELSDVDRVTAYLLRRVRRASREASRTSGVAISARGLLVEAGLGDRLDLRNRHEFPRPDIDYRPLLATRDQLAERLENLPGGYLALVGSPGSGKSTLISEEFADPALRILRYYAFLPGADLSGFLRGESEHFFHDINVSLARLGSHPASRRSASNVDQKREFIEHLAWLHTDFQHTGRRTIIFVDGLDHIAREQQPGRSLLSDLPLPNQLPSGVFMVLGTQNVELRDLPPSVRHELREGDRRVEMCRLSSQQICEIAAAEFPNGADTTELADRLSALSEGHPLSLAVLIRLFRQPPSATSPEEAVARLENVNFVGTDIDGYYERLWEQSEVEDETLGFLGRACRDRLPIRARSAEADLGRSGFRALLARFGHLWQQDPSGHLHVFHNSFRLFLLRKTSADAMGDYDESRHLGYHRDLAARYSQASDPLDRWEVVYHRLESGDRRAALDFVTLDSVRQQIEHFRLPDSLFPDLRVLLRVALEDEDLPKVAEIAIAWNELNLCQYSLGDQYDAIAEELLAAGEAATALRLLTDGRAARLSVSTCLDAAVSLAQAGLNRQAHALFLAAEPLSQLHQLDNSLHGPEEDTLRQWARLAVRFRRPEQVLRMIRSAALEDNRVGLPGASDAETIRNDLLVGFAEGIAGEPAPVLLDEVDREIRGRSRSSWLVLRVRRIQGMPSAGKRRRELAREVVDEYVSIEPASVTTWERLLVAELSLLACEDPAPARRMLDGFPVPRSDEIGQHNQLPRSQEDWFRVFRLRGYLGERPDITEVALPSDEGFGRTTGFLTRHIARMGLLTALRSRGELVTTELLRELRTTIRFMCQRTGSRYADDHFRHVRRLRPAFFELVLDFLADDESLAEIAELFVSSFRGGQGTEPWTPLERTEAFHHLIEAGVDERMSRRVLDDIEHDWPADDPEAASRAEREIRLAKARDRLGDRQRAIGHLRAAVATQGTVDHPKDYQQRTWCRFLADANERDVDEQRRRRRTSLIVDAALTVAQTDAPSHGAAEAAIIDATRWNPAEGAALVNHLAEGGAIAFAAAAGTFVEAGVRQEPTCARVGLAVTRSLLVPLGQPASGLIRAIALPSDGSASLASLAEHAELFALPEDRHAWHRAIVEAADTCDLDMPALSRADMDRFEAERRESTDPPWVSLAPDEHIAIDDACKEVRSPTDFRAFRERASDPNWLRTHDLTAELCRRWDGTLVDGLSRIISEYDREGRELMICAEALERLGNTTRATEIAKAVLETRGEGYGYDWFGNGPLLRAMKLLERLLPAHDFRDVILIALQRYVASEGGFSPAGTELFEEILGRVCDDEAFLAIAEHVERFLNHATRLTRRDESWHRPHRTAREALLGFVAERLSSPVNFVAEAARKALVELVLDHELGQEDVHFICRCVGEDPRAIRGLLASLFAVAPAELNALRAVADWLRDVSAIRDFGLRAEASMILDEIDETLPARPTGDATLIQGFTGQPLVAPPRIVEEKVDSTGYLRDAYDAEEITRLFKPDIDFLAKIAGLDASNVLRRVYDIAVSFGRGTGSRQAEMALRGRLSNASLRLTFHRLRSIAVERAIHQAAAELIDAGRLDLGDVGNLLAFIRTSDPALLRLTPQRAPTDLAPFSPPDAYSTQIEAWLKACDNPNGQIRQLITRQTNRCLVLAEYSKFRVGRRFRSEQRQSNLWINSSAPETLQNPFPYDCGSYASHYCDAAAHEGAIAVRHFPRMEHHGSHCEWIALNANAASALGFRPDSSRPFGWTDGEDFIWTIRWIDGHPLVPPGGGQQADGWMLLGTDGVASKLANLFADIRRFCVVCRKSGEREEESESVVHWSEPLTS